MTLPHILTRSILIEAPRETVFKYFTETESERWADWWGAGSTIEARPGGQVYIRYPNAAEVRGGVVEVVAPERIVFTYGYVSGTPIGIGESRVTIRLEEVANGTRLHLTHDFATEVVRDQHVQGWRHQLSVFSNVLADAVQNQAGRAIEQWYLAWRTVDPVQRASVLTSICTPDVSFRDRWANLETRDDLVAHIGVLLGFMPGVNLESRGTLRHCQGTALSHWAAVKSDAAIFMSGTNIFQFDSLSRIRFVVGFPD